MVRSKYKSEIRLAKLRALRGTKGYQMASKIQGLVRGWMFRSKRRKALSKLQAPKQKSESQADFDMDEDLDAEAFLGVNPDNLEYNDDILAGADDALMEKFIQAMAPAQQTQYPLPPLNKVPKSQFPDRSKPKSF